MALKQNNNHYFSRFCKLTWQSSWSGSAQAGLDGLEPSFTIWGRQAVGPGPQFSQLPSVHVAFGSSANQPSFFHGSMVVLVSEEQQVRASPSDQDFISLCLCRICSYLIGQSGSHDQAQHQHGDRTKGLGMIMTILILSTSITHIYCDHFCEEPGHRVDL